MACNKFTDADWNWRNGDSTNLRVGKMNVPMNYFSCGIYFFDGMFQVVKFPKGMQLYHGSGALANANAEFPAGPDFYRPDEKKIDTLKLALNTQADQESSVEYEASKQLPVSPAWFGSFRVAKTYSLQNKEFVGRCADKCVNVYELREDTTFFILNNNFNIWKILSDMSAPPDIKTKLLFMFSLNYNDVVDQIKFHDENYGEIKLPDKRRVSYREVDLPFMSWLCGYLPDNYAGYAANATSSKGEAVFHLEFTFCNPMRWLTRNLSNPRDWQHNAGLEGADRIIKLFMEQLSYYKTTNVNFHAGNLFEHSVWSLLFAEQLMVNYSAIYKPSVSEQRKIAAAAFLHDIGKIVPEATSAHRRKHDYVYFGIPEHPQIGADYILGKKPLYILDKDMNKTGVLNMPELLTALGFEKEDYEALAKIVELHWDFGYYLNMWKGLNDQTTVNNFINKVGEGRSFYFFYALIIVSIADILATQPFNQNNLTAELNHHSKFFPFIANVPKKYRGGNIADLTANKRELFADIILRTVKYNEEKNQEPTPMDFSN